MEKFEYTVEQVKESFPDLTDSQASCVLADMANEFDDTIQQRLGDIVEEVLENE